MLIPPLKFIEPRDAAQRVLEHFGCTGDEAVQFLCDRWISGKINPRFMGGEPPGGADPAMADWFAGAIVLPAKHLPAARSASRARTRNGSEFRVGAFRSSSTGSSSKPL